jgi:hypothetical protein
MIVTGQPLSRDGLSQEDRLLLACTRFTLDDRTRDEIEDLAKAEIDWRVVFERSKFEGISSLLYMHIQDIPSVASRVPAEILSRLRAIYHGNWARNSVLTDLWSEIMTLFEQAGVQSITHKGMALIHSVYSDPGLRPMADIDLLIRAADLPLVRQTLQRAGFRTPGEDLEAEEAFRCYMHFVRDSTVIDLHWDLAHYSRFVAIIRVDHEGLWKRARSLAVGRAQGLMLCPEDALLHLALHLTLGSEFGRLIWFTDIDAMVRRFAGDLDWERLLEEASRWRIRGILAYTLKVAHESLGSPLPRETLPRLLPGRLRRVALNSVMETTRPPSLGGQMNDIRSYVAETLLMDRLRDVLRVIWTSLFPSRTWVKLHYAVTSKWQISLYRFLHPIRVCYLAAKHLH